MIVILPRTAFTINEKLVTNLLPATLEPLCYSVNEQIVNQSSIWIMIKNEMKNYIATII